MSRKLVETYGKDVNHPTSLIMSGVESDAYILGLATADGGITFANRCYKFRLALNSRDLDILEKVKEVFGKGSICFSTDKSGYKEQHRAIYQVYGEPVHYLMRRGIEPRKTGKEIFPELTGIEERRHFVRGFFDGDGSVMLRYCENLKRFFYQASFIGSEEFITKLHDYLVVDLGMTPKKILTYEHSPTSFYFRLSGRRDLLALYFYMYLGSTISMDRKRIKFKELVTNVMETGKLI